MTFWLIFVNLYEQNTKISKKAFKIIILWIKTVIIFIQNKKPCHNVVVNADKISKNKQNYE